MQFNKNTISISDVERGFSSPRAFASAQAHCPVAKGYASPTNVNAINDGASACTQFLVLPPSNFKNDPYTTPTNKDQQQDDSTSSKWGRAQNQHLKAPKKRDETMTEMKSRTNKAYDPANLTIKAFRLDSASSHDEDSTDNSSPESDHNQAMTEVREQWGEFSQRIMGVQVQGNSLNLPRI